MRGKDDLFHLIKAMSKSEKRYFTLDAKKSGKEAAKYLSLFQTVNNMEEYNEQKLKDKFKKSLSSDKGYLYEAILRSMRDYRSAKSRASQVKERIMDSRYLYERGLYNQFEERLQDAKEMVIELDDNFTLLEIIKEEQLAKQNLTLYSQGYLKGLEQVNLEKSHTIEAVLEELKYLDLYFKLAIQLTKEFELKDELKKQELNKIIPKEIFCESYTPTSPHAKLRYIKCKAFYFQLIGEDDEVFKNWKEVLDWWEAHPKIKEEDFFRYIIDVSNFLNTCFKITKYKNLIPGFLSKLEKEKPRSNHDQGILFHKLTLSKLLYCFSKNEFEEAKKLIPEIENGLKKHNLPNDLVIVGNVVFMLFMTNDYKDCHIWSQKIIQKKSDKREDIQRIVRILNVICLYEIGDIDQLDSAMRAVSRYFKYQKISSRAFEVKVYNFLKKIFNASISDRKSILIDFNNFLKAFRQETKNKQILGLDILLYWVGNTRP
ncbi:MAG: hypothetical protein NXI23_19550 [Bacteroidetes bacterium]|jgi:hypothetical protein|nr:hypothetical protein [Bacteroidota bacterium]MDF1864579.1 hypothetical protein [Saprospiraceae bacterium]